MGGGNVQGSALIRANLLSYMQTFKAEKNLDFF